jgi:serpin B
MTQKLILLGLILLIIGGLSIFSCSFSEEPVFIVDDSGVTVEGIKAVVNANNQFAIDLYQKYKDMPEYEENNIFFSPYSISTALAMTYEGAKGQTADEIREVFHFPEEDNIRRPAFAKIYNEINKEDKKYQLSTANALWAQKDYPFLDEYFSTTKKYYGSKIKNLDFVKETEKSRLTINKWVEEQTNDKIKELLPKDPPVITPDTTLVLTNAIYFKGDWALKFDKNKTIEDDFKISPLKTVKAQMMSLTGEKARFNYAETEQAQILELPYEGDQLSMLILLPKEDNLESLENSLNIDQLNVWRNRLRGTRIDIYLPKFKFETKYFMAKDLADMGMQDAFSSSADFSGMTGKRDLFISEIIHQAFVEVNEEGTEAAAATAVVVLKSCVIIPNIFKADHPFIFIIQQKDTGNILFLGRMMDPSK